MALTPVRLRPLVAADWPAVHGWARLPEACRYQAWGPNTPEQSEAFTRTAADGWRQEPQVRFSFAVLAENTMAGNAELWLRDQYNGEIAYAIHPRLWGRGLATEAAHQLLDLGFYQHGLHRISATCDPRNVASAKVLAKLGMTHEGRLRQDMLIRDGWRDSDVYAMLTHEWRPTGRTAP